MTTSRQKAIGSAAERVVAYSLGGTRVGMDGGPVDVIVEGYLDVQVKAVKALPSLSAVLGYLAAIPKRDRLRACVVMTRPGPGRKAVRTITFDLDEFASWHGFAGVDAFPYDGPPQRHFAPTKDEAIKDAAQIEEFDHPALWRGPG